MNQKVLGKIKLTLQFRHLKTLSLAKGCPVELFVVMEMFYIYTVQYHSL